MLQHFRSNFAAKSLEIWRLRKRLLK